MSHAQCLCLHLQREHPSTIEAERSSKTSEKHITVHGITTTKTQQLAFLPHTVKESPRYVGTVHVRYKYCTALTTLWSVLEGFMALVARHVMSFHDVSVFKFCTRQY
jgi:hypothetical protein